MPRPDPFSGFSVASWTWRQSIVGMANWALVDTGILLSSTSANPPHLSLQHEAAKLFKFTQQTRKEKAPRLTVYQSSYLHLAVWYLANSNTETTMLSRPEDNFAMQSSNFCWWPLHIFVGGLYMQCFEALQFFNVHRTMLLWLQQGKPFFSELKCCELLCQSH